MTVHYQDINNRINQHYAAMSKSHKRIANFIQCADFQLPFMTAAELATAVGTSESTVVRFATAIGFNGYPGMQRALRETMQEHLTTAERFELSKDLYGDDHLISKVMLADIDNIRQTAEQLDTQTLKSVVAAINHAQKVYILGNRSSKILAEYLAFYLNFILDDVHLLARGANDMFDEIVNIDISDVLIVFSFPRYSNRTFEIASFARERKATIIGITDNPTSPIVDYSQYALTAKHNMSTFIDSFAAPMSLVNAIIIALTTGQRDKLSNKFALLEEIWSLNDVYK